MCAESRTRARSDRDRTPASTVREPSPRGLRAPIRFTQRSATHTPDPSRELGLHHRAHHRDRRLRVLRDRELHQSRSQRWRPRPPHPLRVDKRLPLGGRSPPRHWRHNLDLAERARNRTMGRNPPTARTSQHRNPRNPIRKTRLRHLPPVQHSVLCRRLMLLRLNRTQTPRGGPSSPRPASTEILTAVLAGLARTWLSGVRSAMAGELGPVRG